MRRQNEVLSAAGYSFADLVLTKIYLAEPAGYVALNEAYRQFVTAPPPARATIHAKAVRPGELLQVQSVAVRGSGAGRPSGEGITSPIHSYSVLAAPRLYITGMTGRKADGTFSPDLAGQTRQALAMISEQLERHAFGFGDVVETTVWLRDLGDFKAMTGMLPVRGARTIVGIPPNSQESLVEIQMVAEKPGHRAARVNNFETTGMGI
jgi:enamine deaminase RidA (YjgF/YER057c/UK114 family)